MKKITGINERFRSVLSHGILLFTKTKIVSPYKKKHVFKECMMAVNRSIFQIDEII